jgi:hypothetical protein
MQPKSRKHPKGKHQQGKNFESPTPAEGYVIEMSEQAQAAYTAFFERAETAKTRGDISNYHITALNMIDEVIENIIPRDPFNKRYALSGNLSRIFRMQKGRLRISWVGSSEKRKICIVFISETLRKDGDVNDPYRLLSTLVLSGQFDEIFEELGLRRPSSVPRQNVIPQ